MGALEDVDPTLARLVHAERARQGRVLDMVASENLAPAAVREAQGSVLTNKYADGYPGRRLYDGCDVVDEIEQLAIDRATALFGAAHANVQLYSGSSANTAVLRALCEPGDTVLGFDSGHGGHPSQHAASFPAGHFYRGVAYGVGRDGRIDLDAVREVARVERPKVIFAGGSCYPRALDFAPFRAIADEVGAALVVDMAHLAGLVATGRHPDPVPVADVCTLTVHKTLGGARGAVILCRADLADRIDAAVFPGTQGGPLMHVIAGIAASLAVAATEAFAERIDRTVRGARIVADVLGEARDRTRMPVLTGGTDTHLLCLDTAPAGLSAQQALRYLHFVGISGSAMRIPFDAATAPETSGLRLGTTLLATRGFDDDEFAEVADILAVRLSDRRGETLSGLAARVRALCERFPIDAATG